MATISGVARPAYVYDAANNQWVPIGVGPHTHSLADLPSVVSTNGGSTIVNQAPTLKGLVIQGASAQTANLFEIQNSSGTATYTYSAAGNVGINTTNLSGKLNISSPNPTTDLTIEPYSDSTKRHIIRADNDILRLIGTWTGGTPGGIIAMNTGGATGGERLRIDADGNIQIGAGVVASNTLRFHDIYNVDSGVNAGVIQRLITNNATNSAVTSADIIKYRNGNFFINNNDSTGNGNFYLGNAGTHRLQISPTGNIAIKLTQQSSPYVSDAAALEVNQGGGQMTAWFKNYGGTTAAPTELSDWPFPVIGVTTYGNFYMNKVMRFGYPGDNMYQTDNSLWNFTLNGSTVTGWDNNSNTTPRNTTDANVGFEIRGPGNLRLGTDGAKSVFLMTSGQDYAQLNSLGYFLIGYTTSNGAYKLQVNSQIFATSASIATSDGRYKENVEELTGGIDMIKALRPVEFNWKKQEDITLNDKLVREAHAFPEGKTIGFIAQEVQEALGDKPWVNNIIKENVREAIKDSEGKEVAPKEEFLGIAETNLIAVLVSAVKELTAKVEALEAKLKK